ncbi:hypothetical protein [Dactylosporangium cerinum]
MTQRPERRRQRAKHPASLCEWPDIDHDAPSGDPITRIAVWRLDDSNDDHLDADPNTVFTSQLTKRLILMYSNRGDTIVDLDNDAQLLTAARAAGREHLAITDTADIAVLDELHSDGRQIGLVTVQWPRPAQLDVPHPPQRSPTCSWHVD